jgi:peroxiredoxin
MVGLAAPLVVSCGASPAVSAGADPQNGASAERPQARPPEFTLDSLDGRSVSLGQYLGKNVILIDFWATFCEPCLTAMPHLDSLYRQYRDQGFVVLGISIDGPDSIAQVKTVVARLGVSFPILLDQETRVVGLYNPKTSAPYSVLIGRDGRIIRKKEGYTTGDASSLTRDIEAAIKNPRAEDLSEADRDVEPRAFERRENPADAAHAAQHPPALANE